MSGGHGKGPTWSGVLFGFIGVIIVMFVIWYYTGGPERAKVADPFLKAPAPIDTGETYGPNGN